MSIFRRWSSRGKPPAERDEIAASVFFDPEFYADESGKASTYDLVSHYCKIGWRSGLSPSRYFDTKYYLDTNPDVRASDTNPLLHFLRNGWVEGRAPSGSFDPDRFLAEHPDLRGTNPAAACIAWYGSLRWRHPGAGVHPPERLPPTDAEQVARILLGDAAAVSESEGPRESDVVGILRRAVAGATFRERLAAPFAAGRTVYAPAFVDPPSAHDRQWAADRLPLTPAGRSEALKARAWHQLHRALFDDPAFLAGSMMEGSLRDAFRTAPWPEHLSEEYALIDRSGLFDRDWYLRTYPDIAASSGDALGHFLSHGAAEGRNPSGHFETRWYRSAHLLGQSGRINPVLHYLVFGLESGLDPHPFVPAGALRDVSASGKASSTIGDALRRTIAAVPPFTAYDVERLTRGHLDGFDRPSMIDHVRRMERRPRFLILQEDGPGETDAEEQTYPLARRVAGRRDVAATASEWGATHLVWLDAGDVLHRDALYRFAAALDAEPDVDILYGDHDISVEPGRAVPAHKPSWSPDYFESYDYVGSAACFDLNCTLPLLAGAIDRRDLILGLTETARSVRRIPHILVRTNGSKLSGSEPARTAIDGRLRRTGRSGNVSAIPNACDAFDIDLRLSREPLVSVVLPTAGRSIVHEGRPIDLVAHCIETIERIGDYPNLEVIIVDSGDLDRSRISTVRGRRPTFISDTGAEVNIARKINLGVAQAKGDVLLILNDDVEPITPHWVQLMLAHLEKAHVGVVGAKLLYPDMTIQHAGIVLSGRDPDHVRRHWPRSDQGYLWSGRVPRNYLAVTGAVMMTRTDLFREVGGYSEEFPIDYNDIDFCLKVGATCRTVVFEPRAELIHFESVSMVKPHRPQDRARFHAKWPHVADDPFYDQDCFATRPATFELRYDGRRAGGAG